MNCYISNLLFVLLAAITESGNLAAQDTIRLTNPSFEDVARASLPPRGWIDCGFPEESAPDVQPSGAWDVFKPAHDGFTYLGMVVRENGTWERVGQALPLSMKPGHCYLFSIFLCQSSEYWSQVVPDGMESQETRDLTPLPEVNFNQPVLLRIWGGHGSCDQLVMLAESVPIDHTDWEEYEFLFQVDVELTHIMLEAYYAPHKTGPYNGNLLLDKAGDIVPIDCLERKP